RGIGPIVGVDPVADRRALALELGATTAVAELREVRSHVAQVPAVIECSGYAPLLHGAADLVAPGGRLVLVGVPFGEATVVPLMWVTREIEIVGSIASDASDFAVSLAMLAADPGIARVATRRVGLAQVPDVFEELITPSSGAKVVVDPHL
ncbi:MAG: zinc-binding dehydrogenase, partial [Candidatus Dormiibacterota bacterium]